MLSAQRGPVSESNCRFASSQSDSASPGSANLRRRSEMKYARIRISSSDGPAIVPASGGIVAFAFCEDGLFLRTGPALFRLVGGRCALDDLLGFTFAVDPAASGDV
jgi:hypothetical protein